MTRHDELVTLARRVEALSEPNFAIEQEIGQAIFADNPWPARPYTADLGAAITLVPAGWWWSSGDCSVSADASMGPDVAHCDKATLVRFDQGLHLDLSKPSWPAQAMTALALVAHAALSEPAA